jgi:hypothetical protein
LLFSALVAAGTALPGDGQTPARATSQIPRMPDGKPNFTGLWEALGMADWDIRDHSAQPGPFFQLGAIGATPAGQGIVDGGEIPYTPAAAAQQKENFRNRMKQDPEVKCYMPGIPRANYMPFPFQIVQSQHDIAFAYEYATSNRVVIWANLKGVPFDEGLCSRLDVRFRGACRKCPTARWAERRRGESDESADSSAPYQLALAAASRRTDRSRHGNPASDSSRRDQRSQPAL